MTIPWSQPGMTIPWGQPGMTIPWGQPGMTIPWGQPGMTIPWGLDTAMKSHSHFRTSSNYWLHGIYWNLLLVPYKLTGRCPVKASSPHLY